MPHAHDRHDHSHRPTVNRGNERTVLIAFALTFTFMIVEAVGGLISGSLALLADAGHMFTDAAALGLAWLAFRMGRREADNRRTFGFLRLEVLAGFINALTLFAIAAWIGIEAWQRLREPSAVLAGPMLTVAIMGLLINLMVLWILSRGDTEHVNIRGALLHVIGDLLGSVGAIAAAVTIQLTGWTPIDPLLSVLVAALVLRSAWKLIGASTHILLEGAPEGATPEAILSHLQKSVPGVQEVSHIHVWSITSGQMLATLHATPTPGAVPQAIARDIESELSKRFRIHHATVAIDHGQASTCSLPLAAPE